MSPRVLASWRFARAIRALDEIFQPQRASVRSGDALRVQRPGPTTCLWLIVDIPAALRHDCKEQIFAPRFEEELAVRREIIHAPRRKPTSRQSLAPPCRQTSASMPL